MEKPANTNTPIDSLLQHRWSPRAFDDKLIDPQIISKLFEAARWSPSWRNDQPWRFIIATRDDAEEFQRLHACLTPGNQRWAIKAAMLIVVVAKRQYDHHKEPNPMTLYDTGQAMAHLTVEAMSNGLYVHQMAGINRGKVRDTYQITGDHDPLVGAAVGYLGRIDDLPEDLQTKERGERTRIPMNEIVFKGRWKNPADLA